MDKQTRSIGAASKIILKNETDSSGSLLKAALPYNDSAKKTTYLYGANGQISEVTDPLGQKTSFYYSNAAYATNDAEGNLQQTVKTVEPDGKETWTYNDKLGRKTRVEEKKPDEAKGFDVCAHAIRLPSEHECDVEWQIVIDVLCLRC
ncbi:RHS repeat domain-containing protein [Paenibacillus curdlanolyticus]